jgi:RNA polymerase sigma factor (sigma-70 family)
VADVSLELARFRVEADPNRKRMLLNLIVSKQQGMIRKLTAKAARQEKSGEDFDDLLQAGMIGFCRAVKGFDPDKKCKLSTYAAFWVRHEVQEATRASRELRLPRIPLRKHDRDRVVIALRANPSATAEELGINQRALDQTKNSIGLIFVNEDAPRADRHMNAMALEAYRENPIEAAIDRQRYPEELEELPMEAIDRLANAVTNESRTKSEICASAGISESEWPSIYKGAKQLGKAVAIFSGTRTRYCAPAIAVAETKRHQQLKSVRNRKVASVAPSAPSVSVAPYPNLGQLISLAARYSIDELNSLDKLPPEKRVWVLSRLAA